MNKPGDAEKQMLIPPLTVLVGPSGVDLEAAAEEELCFRSVSGGPDDQKVRLKVVNLLFGDSIPEFNLTDNLPSQNDGRSVLLLKNAQRLSPEALPAFESTIRQLEGTNASCVCTFALPLPRQSRTAFGASFDRLRAEGLLRHVTLRPRPASSVGALVAEKLGAQPESLLVSWLWGLTRGWPSAISTALDIYRDNGMMTVVDRHAYLTGHCAPTLAENHELVLAVRRLGVQAWTVAKATAALSPLGEAMPRLIGLALGIPASEVSEQLALLEETGTLRYSAAESVWLFRIPLVAAVLKSRLGPFEGRRLAQVAVTALWSGEATCPDPGYLADQLVAAGRMVDPERARAELLAQVERISGAGDDRAIRWLRAAAELTADRGERAGILLRHARTCMVHGEAELALESSDAVLRGLSDEIPDGQLLPVFFVHLSALHEAKNMEALEKIADGLWWPWPGTVLERAIAQAHARSLLGRWRDTHRLLEEVRQADEVDEVAGYLRFVSPIANLWLGVVDEFDGDVATLPARVEAGEEAIGEIICHTGALLALGEPGRAEDLLARTRKVHIQLGPAAQAMRVFYRGDVDEALELTRKHIATSSPNGCDAYQTVMIQLAATVQLHRGKLARSRELLATADSRHSAVPHALAVPRAWHEMVIGEGVRARNILMDALRQTEESRIVAFTDALWANLADLEHRSGREDELPEYLHNLEKIAEQLSTEPAEIRRLTLRAFVHGDRAAADAAIGLARRRGQPLEQALVLERLVRYHVADPVLLLEVYSLLGDLDALLARALARPLMREHGIAVPGRQATVAENERLLAVLVAEGLGNKQIATLLSTTEKSVEGRLSRLFSRTGYQSRVELAAAVLGGRFEA